MVWGFFSISLLPHFRQVASLLQFCSHLIEFTLFNITVTKCKGKRAALALEAVLKNSRSQEQLFQSSGTKTGKQLSEADFLLRWRLFAQPLGKVTS